MAKLPPLLDRLIRHDEAAARAGESGAKLVVASGRRGRIEGDGDFETVSAAALSEDEVRDLLQQTGGGTRVDRLDGKPTEWTFRHEGTSFVVHALVDGRELRATIRRARPDEPTRPARPITTGNEDRSPPIREEFAPRRKDPRADESQTLGAVREERTVTRAKTVDPRADEEPAPSPARRDASREAPKDAPRDTAREAPKEKRRDSRARRTTPRAVGRSGSKREIPRHAGDGEGAAAAKPTSDDAKAWTEALGGVKRPPLFSLEAPDADVRELEIDPDDAFNRSPRSRDEAVHRAVTARGPDAVEQARIADLRAARDVTVRAPIRPEPRPAREPLPAVFGVDEDHVPREPPAKTEAPREQAKPVEPRPPTGRDEPRAPDAGREPPKAEPPRELPRGQARPDPRPVAPPSSNTTRDERPVKAQAIEVDLAKPAKVAPPPPPSSPETLEPAITLARSPADGTPGLDPALEKLVVQARSGGASDLHIVAGRPAIARIGGALVPAGGVLADAAVESMIRASIPAGRLATFERDGGVSFAAVVGTVARVRVAVSRQRTGLKASIRILPPEPSSLSELELPEALDRALQHHQGLVVISGPSGQGKTTTLAAMVDHLNANTTHHVLTVEDPIEFVHPRKKAMMSQREVGTHTKSFANALRSSLREDPDVIVVGELRDVETVRTALSASETGHLVIGTINTPSAPKTIDRLIDLFPPAEQPQVRATLAAALRLVASQRLVPRRDGAGRVAAVEILPGSLALANLIRDGRTFQIPSLMQRGRGAGVVRLDDELLDLVRRGVVDKKDALAAADDPTELQASLEGRGDGKPRPPTGEPAAAAKPPPAADDDGRGGKALWQRAADMFRRGGS